MAASTSYRATGPASKPGFDVTGGRHDHRKFGSLQINAAARVWRRHNRIFYQLPHTVMVKGDFCLLHKRVHVAARNSDSALLGATSSTSGLAASAMYDRRGCWRQPQIDARPLCTLANGYRDGDDKALFIQASHHARRRFFG